VLVCGCACACVSESHEGACLFTVVCALPYVTFCGTGDEHAATQHVETYPRRWWSHDPRPFSFLLLLRLTGQIYIYIYMYGRDSCALCSPVCYCFFLIPSVAQHPHGMFFVTTSGHQLGQPHRKTVCRACQVQGPLAAREVAAGVL